MIYELRYGVAQLIPRTVREWQTDDRGPQFFIGEPVAGEVDGEQCRHEIVAGPAPALCDQDVGNLVAGAERIFRDSIKLFEIRRKNVRDAENRRSKRTAHFVRHVEPLRPYGERVRVRERRGKVARTALGDAIDEFFCGPPHRRPQRLDRLDRNSSADQTAQTRVHGTVAIEHEQLPPARERS